MPIFLYIVLGAVILCPIICFIVFIYSLIELIKDIRGMKKNPENVLEDDIHKQIGRMVFTGILGAVIGALDAFGLVQCLLIFSGAIPAM